MPVHAAFWQKVPLAFKYFKLLFFLYGVHTRNHRRKER